jgi:hypothetical protein
MKKVRVILSPEAEEVYKHLNKKVEPDDKQHNDDNNKSDTNRRPSFRGLQNDKVDY